MTNSNNSQPWAIYIRVSTRHQAESGFSLDEQRDTLLAHAEAQGWAWTEFSDAGLSGETLDNRPGMLSLLEAIDAGEVVGVLVVDESRLARDELAAAIIRDHLRRAGAKLALPGRGELDLSDPSSAFMAGILGQVHAFEQQLRTKKMKAGLRRTVAAGYWPGGPAPYGYRLVDADGSRHKSLVVNEEEADVLRLIANLLICQSHSTYTAATYLNAQGVRTRRGNLWRHPNLRRHIQSSHLTGTWTYRPGHEAIQMSIPAIFTLEEWRAVQRSINGAPRPQRQHRLYPLSGRAKRRVACICGESMTGMVRVERKGRPYYRCSHAESTYGDDRCQLQPQTYRAIDLEKAVWKGVLAVLTDPDYLLELASLFLADEDDPDTNDIEQRRIGGKLERLRQQRTSIVRKLADSGQLDALEDALAEVNEEAVVLQTQLDDLIAKQALREERMSLPERLSALAEIARTRLINPDEKLMAAVFDLLDLRIHLVEPYRFEGTGTIPLPHAGDEPTDGEVSEVGLRSRALHRPRSCRGASPAPP